MIDTLLQPRFRYASCRHAPARVGAPAVAASDVRAVYPGATSLALDEVSLQVPVGAQIALVGANGSGKSTLLKAIAGLLPLQGGMIQTFGLPVGSCQHRVAYLPQRGDVDWRFPVDVRKLVVTGRYVHLGWFKRPKAHDWQVADQMLDRLGLGDLKTRQIGQLSGGQQQRALLARALTQEADLLLLDEPLNAVDAETREIVTEVLHDLKRQGTSLVVATHDLGRLEADFDGALYLQAGHEVPPPPGSFIGLAVGLEAV